MSVRRLFGGLLAVSLAGCLGGQTGQPTVDTGGDVCIAPTVGVPVDRPLRGVVPVDAARAFEGAYTQPLDWVDSLGVPLTGVPEDEVTLSFTYDGGLAFYDPCASGGPSIDMLLDVATRDHGVLMSGVARVSFFPPRNGPEPYGPSGAFGTFTLYVESGSLTGGMRQTETGTTISGTLSTTSVPAPLHGAVFPPPP